MRQRSIPEEAVIAVLTSPSVTWPDAAQGSIALSGTYNGRALKVWVVGDRWPITGTLKVKSTAWRDGT